MLLSWIVKSIPRSPRAFLALLVMLGSLALLLSGLQEMFEPIGQADNTAMAMKTTLGLVIGLPATAVFYWFQTVEDRKRHSKGEFGVLNHYTAAQNRDRIYKENQAISAFTGEKGGVTTPPAEADAKNGPKGR